MILVISFVTPIFLAFFFPLAIFYQNMQRYYISSSRELKRLDSISRSPIYNHFTETLNGTPSIRAFQGNERFVIDNEQRLDDNQTAYFVLQTSNRWLGVRLEFIGTCVVTIASFFAVFQRGTINAGLAGLSISYALQLTGVLNWLVRVSTETETGISYFIYF